jgi:hypothetical protein
VAEYFSPRAKQRLCLSQYESAGHHALGMFPQAAPVSLFLALGVLIFYDISVLHPCIFSHTHGFSTCTIYEFHFIDFSIDKSIIFSLCLQDMWQCDLCGTKSGKGFGKLVANFILVCTYISVPSLEHNEATYTC